MDGRAHGTMTRIFDTSYRLQRNQIIFRGFPERGRHIWRFGNFSWYTHPGPGHINTHVHSTVKTLKLTHHIHTSTSQQKLKEWWLFALKLRENNMRKSADMICKLLQPGFLPAAGTSTHLSIISPDWQTRCSILHWAGAVGPASCSDGERWSRWWGDEWKFMDWWEWLDRKFARSVLCYIRGSVKSLA